MTIDLISLETLYLTHPILPLPLPQIYSLLIIKFTFLYIFTIVKINWFFLKIQLAWVWQRANQKYYLKFIQTCVLSWVIVDNYFK